VKDRMKVIGKLIDISIIVQFYELVNQGSTWLEGRGGLGIPVIQK
jgi:hypothetical protein